MYYSPLAPCRWQIPRLERIGVEHPSLASTLDTAWVRLGVMPVGPWETVTVPAPPLELRDSGEEALYYGEEDPSTATV